jgi:hypothetical protein
MLSGGQKEEMCLSIAYNIDWIHRTLSKINSNSIAIPKATMINLDFKLQIIKTL